MHDRFDDLNDMKEHLLRRRVRFWETKTRNRTPGRHDAMAEGILALVRAQLRDFRVRRALCEGTREGADGWLEPETFVTNKPMMTKI